MNGFINGFIGLNEYCETFPADTLAGIMRDSCYNSLLESFQYFDTPDWTTYSRGSWNVMNDYMRYQLQELEHLYSLCHDERIRNQMRIWAYFAIDKPDQQTKFLKNPDYQFGKRIPGNEPPVFQL